MVKASHFFQGTYTYLQLKESTQHTSLVITDMLNGIVNLTNDLQFKALLIIEPVYYGE